MTETTSSQLGIHVRLNTDFETAIQRVTDALKVEGLREEGRAIPFRLRLESCS